MDVTHLQGWMFCGWIIAMLFKVKISIITTCFQFLYCIYWNSVHLYRYVCNNIKVISLLTCLCVVLKKQLLFAALSSLAFDLNISIDTVFQIFTRGEKRKSQTALSLGNFSIFCKTFSKPTYLPSLAFPSFSTFPTNYLTWQPPLPPKPPPAPLLSHFSFSFPTSHSFSRSIPASPCTSSLNLALCLWTQRSVTGQVVWSLAGELLWGELRGASGLD